MKGKSVRSRIFISNTLMVVLILFLFFSINVLVLKGHSHQGTGKTEVSASETDKSANWDDEDFILLFAVDGVISIGVLLGISLIFTNRITKRIVAPLTELNNASDRIRNGDLSQDISYSGYREFEEVCNAFNVMQHEISEERERNAHYEKARTDMIAGISHDLRTPLTVIRGTVKGLKDGVASTPEMQDKFLDTALCRTAEMDELLDQLFFFSRLETGKLPVSLTEVSLNEFADAYRQDKQEDSRLSGMRFTVEYPEEPLVLEADPLLLRRILDNLLENSRKYAANPSPEAVLDIRSENNRVVLHFSDNGPGVSDEALPHLFEQFYREDESRNRQKGSGLGLYIVKYLTEAMGGSVSAENDGGLVITLSFPEKGAQP